MTDKRYPPLSVTVVGVAPEVQQLVEALGPLGQLPGFGELADFANARAAHAGPVTDGGLVVVQFRRPAFMLLPTDGLDVDDLEYIVYSDAFSFVEQYRDKSRVWLRSNARPKMLPRAPKQKKMF